MVLNIAIKFKYMHTFIKKHRTRASPASEDQLSKIPPFPTKWVLGVCVCVSTPVPKGSHSTVWNLSSCGGV